jgi:hypothetical protein
MSSYLGAQLGNDRGSVERGAWGRKNIDPLIATFGGDDLVPLIRRDGTMVTRPRREACVVFTGVKGHGGDRRGTLLGFFDYVEAHQLTCCQCPAKDTPVLKCICKRQEGLPFFGDSITGLGDKDWTNEAHRFLAQHEARDWMGGAVDMNILHVHAHLYSLIQCMIFRAQDASPLLSAIVPLFQSFCRGHLVFDGWTKITIEMTHNTLLNDQTQKMMSHIISRWLADVKPELFVKQPLVAVNRLLWMKMLATTLRRSVKKGTKDVSKNAGLQGIYTIVPMLGAFAETCHVPLAPGSLDRLIADYLASNAALKAAFTANPGPVGSLIALTEHLKTGAPLTKEQAGQMMAFCTKTADQSQFPDWVALGILAPKEKSIVELSVELGPFDLTHFKGVQKTFAAEFEQDPRNEHSGFVKGCKSNEWSGFQPTLEGEGTLVFDYAGIAREATGKVGEWGVGNWRATYGVRGSRGDVLDPTRFGFSSAGVRCDPRIAGRDKWIQPRAGDLVPACDHPVRYTFQRPNYRVTVNGQTVLDVVLRPDEFPLFSFKGVRIHYTHVAPAVVASATAAAAPKAVSWLESVKPAAGGAGGPREESKTPSPPAVADPNVAKILAQMKAAGSDAVMGSVLNATMPTGDLSPFEKDLTVILAEVGKKGLSEALKEAQRLFSA